MNIESGRRAKDDERLAMLAALVSGDVPLACLPVRLRTDRVHQVVGRIDIERHARRRPVQHDGRHHLHLRAPGLRVQLLRRRAMHRT